ncbi:hypothetical protein [Nonomuraea aridisoli]|nr:hypothetical protein [Nonomuraea aridisoli]
MARSTGRSGMRAVPAARVTRAGPSCGSFVDGARWNATGARVPAGGADRS